MRTRFGMAMAVALAGAGCSYDGRARRPPAEPRVVLHPEGRPAVVVRVEVARSEAETQRGLMYRDRLDDGRGMLFLFKQPRRMVFWMRNTYIPLDMIFLTGDRRVLGTVESAQPLTDDPRSVDGLSQYVLEVPGGWAARHRIAPGTPADFVDLD